MRDAECAQHAPVTLAAALATDSDATPYAVLALAASSENASRIFCVHADVFARLSAPLCSCSIGSCTSPGCDSICTHDLEVLTIHCKAAEYIARTELGLLTCDGLPRSCVAASNLTQGDVQQGAP